MSKETILAAVNAFPQEVALEELIERLIFMEKVEEGLRDSEAGRTISQQELKQLVQSWSK